MRSRQFNFDNSTRCFTDTSILDLLFFNTTRFIRSSLSSFVYYTFFLNLFPRIFCHFASQNFTFFWLDAFTRFLRNFQFFISSQRGRSTHPYNARESYNWANIWKLIASQDWNSHIFHFNRGEIWWWKDPTKITRSASCIWSFQKSRASRQKSESGCYNKTIQFWYW